MFVDTGLDLALRWTKALHESSIDMLANMKSSELSQLSSQVLVKNILFNPELTLIDLCMQVGCFRTVGERTDERNIRPYLL